MKKILCIAFAACFFLAACAPQIDQSELVDMVAKTLAAMPSQTPYPTYTAAAMPEVQLPTEAARETPVPVSSDPKSEKMPGFYLVGSEISPGIWRNSGNSDRCYWEITTSTGEVIDNFIGMTGGTMYIPPEAFQVRLEAECGNWVFIE